MRGSSFAVKCKVLAWDLRCCISTKSVDSPAAAELLLAAEHPSHLLHPKSPASGTDVFPGERRADAPRLTGSTSHEQQTPSYCRAVVAIRDNIDGCHCHRRIARSADRIQGDGLRLAPMALHLQPAVAAVEALSDGGRRLRRAQVKSRFLRFWTR